MNRITLREGKETQRADANEHLKTLKAKEAKKHKEFVSRRVDARTIVVARPSHINDFIEQLNKD